MNGINRLGLNYPTYQAAEGIANNNSTITQPLSKLNKNETDTFQTETFETKSNNKKGLLIGGLIAIGAGICLFKTKNGKQLLNKVKDFFTKNIDKTDDAAKAVKIQDVTYKNGTALVNGKKFTGVIDDVTKSGKKVQMTYKNGNIIQSKMDDVLKQYTWGKDGKKLTTTVTKTIPEVPGKRRAGISNTIITYDKGKVSSKINTNTTHISKSKPKGTTIQKFDYDKSSGKLDKVITKKISNGDISISKDWYHNGKISQKEGLIISPDIYTANKVNVNYKANGEIWKSEIQDGGIFLNPSEILK